MSKRSERREAERQTRKNALRELKASPALSPNSRQSEKCGTESADLSAHRAPTTPPHPNPRAAAVAVPVISPHPNSPVPALDPPPTDNPPTWSKAFVQHLNQISEAQQTANQTNSKLSTGPATEEGKAISSQNARTHGLSSSVVRTLPTENITDYQALAHSIYAEHTPESDTEQRLADMMITSHWLMQRAIRLQQDLMFEPELDTRKMSLFLRYQTTHERSYYRAHRELKSIQKERRNNENGFVSQNQKEQSEQAESARLEALQSKARLQNARARTLEVNAACRQVMEIPLPGHTTLTFEELTKACSHAIATATLHKQQLQMEAAA